MPVFIGTGEGRMFLPDRQLPLKFTVPPRPEAVFEAMIAFSRSNNLMMSRWKAERLRVHFLGKRGHVARAPAGGERIPERKIFTGPGLSPSAMSVSDCE
jgi:hypothetical protein